MAGRRVPFSHPFFSQNPDEFWSSRYQGMPPEFWSSAGFSAPSGQGPPAGFSAPSGQGPPAGAYPPGAQVQSQRTHQRREIVSGTSGGGDFPSSQIWEQYFGGDGGDKKGVTSPTTFYIRRPDFQRQNSGTSEIKSDDKSFKVALDVAQFTPDELDVRVVDGDVLIHAKHEQREDEHGTISRQFTRRYTLPEDVDPESVKSSLSQEGVLSIEAPRKNAKAIEGQKVPIQFVAKSNPPADGAAAAPIADAN